jgi:DNA-binding phage protein
MSIDPDVWLQVFIMVAVVGAGMIADGALVVGRRRKLGAPIVQVLNTPEATRAYLLEVLESGDEARFKETFKAVARAQGWTLTAEQFELLKADIEKASGSGPKENQSPCEGLPRDQD